MLSKKLSFTFFSLLTILLAVGILSYQLFREPVTGLADNGDFARNIAIFKLKSTATTYQEQYFNYIIRKFGLAPYSDSRYYSSQQILIGIAVLANKLISKDGLFDICVIGLINAAAFIVAIGVLLKGIRQKKDYSIEIVICSSILLLFLDAGYITYFNSFYSEPVTLIGAVAATGFFLWLVWGDDRAVSKKWLLAGFAFTCVLIITSRTSAAYLSLLFAILIYRLSIMVWHQSGPFSIARWALPLLLIIVSIIYFFSVNLEYSKYSRFNAVFVGMLYQSPHLAQDFTELGLSDQYMPLVGKNYWGMDPYLYESQPIQVDTKVVDSPQFQKDFFDRISYGSVLSFYLRHPGRLYDQVVLAINAGMRLAPSGLGQYEKSSGLPPFAKSKVFNVWSAIRDQLSPHAGIIFIFLLVSGLAAAGFKRFVLDKTINQKLVSELHLVFILIMVSQLIVSIIGDGQQEIIKHLFLYNVFFDGNLMFLLIYLIKTPALLLRRFHR